MNRSDFLKILENAGPSDRHTTGEINEIIDIFPYCHSAYMLFLKGLQNTSDISFENQLRKSAIYIADREVLYYFLRSEKQLDDKKDKNISEPSLQTPDLTDESITDSQQVVIETARNSEDLISEIEKFNSDAFDGRAEEQDTGTDHGSMLFHTESENEDSSSILFYIDDESETEEERVVFMDPGFAVPPEDEELLELDDEDNITKTEDGLIKEDISERESSDNAKQKQSELIEKFILANPRIEPRIDKEDMPGEDISKPFTEEKGEFITETLAKIYTTQGYYSRAIDIYEKLSLKFPEKSSYFASQIEKVKELIKK